MAQRGEQRLAISVVGYGGDAFTGARGLGQFLESIDGLGHRHVVLLLLFEALDIVVALGIQQAQAREVALQPHLFWRGGEQQQARDLRGELFHALVAGAAAFWAPVQVMCFIDNQQVEAAGQGLVLAMNVGEQPALAGQHELGALERVGAAVGLALVLVQQCHV